MDNWRGFSTEDIKNIQHLLEKENDVNLSLSQEEFGSLGRGDTFPHTVYSSPSTTSLGRKRSSNKPSFRKDTKRLQENAILSPIPPEARLGHFIPPKENGSSSSLETSSTSASSQSSTSQTPYRTTSPANISASSETAVTILVGEDKSYQVIHSPPVEDMSMERNGDARSRSLQKAFLLEKDKSRVKADASMELFQERQRMMEEQNNRKKELLTKAIADRKRQTQSEAKKIVQIQEELNRLDALLSTDVSILRNQIELASFDFNEAQKRYDKAECEFIEAKMQLFSKLERKELLTEHLCKIIETNEQRKAKKLSELMAKLEISDEKIGVNLTDDEMCVFPAVVSLDDLSYSARRPEEPRSNLGSEVSKADRNHALGTINLITAQNMDHRSAAPPCDLNGSDQT